MDLKKYQAKLIAVSEHIAEQYYPELNDKDDGDYILNETNRFFLSNSIQEVINNHFASKEYLGDDIAIKDNTYE